MDIEQSELMAQLQGTWKQNNDDQIFEIYGTELLVTSSGKTIKTSFELVRNLQLRNWQIKITKPMLWLRTFIVALNENSFTIYDFDLKINMAMGARSKLLNPTRTYKYTRVAVAETV